jgi:hypothetical protein
MMTALVQLAYDPDKVKPGWIALVIVVLLAIATFLLWRSMNTQLRKIQLPPRGSSEADKPDSTTTDDDAPPP